MLIDEVEESLRLEKLMISTTRRPTTTYLNDVREQIELLDEACPRYDINNVVSVLMPKIVHSANPSAPTRNAELLAKRSTLLKIAGNAPLGPPWDCFYLEYRHNDLQRGGFLVRWDAENRRHKCTLLYDGVDTEGIELVPNAFEIILGSDDLFSGYAFGEIPEDMRIVVEKQAELIRTAIELLNWDREDVPTVTYTHEKHGKIRRKQKQRASKKSNPAIIKFEPFLKEVLSGAHRASEGAHAAPVLHLVRGHYKNFKYDAPRFGHKPVLGKTYGRLWNKPHLAGKSSGSAPTTPNAVIKIGELACA